MKKLVEERDFDDDLLCVEKLYVGKLGYQNPYGDYHECKDGLVVGVFNPDKKDFEDVLNFKKYSVRGIDSVIRKDKIYCVDDLMTLKEYLADKEIEVDYEIKRKDLREIIYPVEVKDEVLRKIVYLYDKIDDSLLTEDKKNYLKDKLYEVMNNYVEGISSCKENSFLPPSLKQITDYSLQIIESMIPPKDIKEIEQEGIKLRKRLFDKKGKRD